MKSTIFECKAHSNKIDIFFLEFLADISKENFNKKKLYVNEWYEFLECTRWEKAIYSTKVSIILQALMYENPLVDVNC